MKTKLFLPALALITVLTFTAKADDWLDLMARRIIASLDDPCNRARLARGILCRTHPTGENPSISLVRVVRSYDGASLNVVVTLWWNGGITGTNYTTVVTWRVCGTQHLQACVTSDDAVFKVSRENKLRLNTYFQESFEAIFPAERH